MTAGEVNSVGGKSGLQRAGRWATPSRGDPKESATEKNRLAALISGEAPRGKGEKVGQEPTGDRATGRPGKPRPEQDQIGGRSDGCSPSPRVSVARGAGQPASQTDGHRPVRDTEPGLKSALGPQPGLNSKIRVHFWPRDTEGFAYWYAICTHPLVGLSSGDGALAAIRSPGNRMLTRSHARHSVSRILSRCSVR